MASRRDELNAYTFARKRMVGAFLQPGGGGNDEDAPRPIRAVLPSFVIGAVIVAGFGMWGVIKPSAPPNWDNGKYILQGKTSTTRYVILTDQKSGQPMLHQVLNMSSARLVLAENATVQTVADEVLDKYPRRGPAIGIPYAPDKLPKVDDAGISKLWSVCDKQGKENLSSQVAQSMFIAAGADAKTLQGERKLKDNQSLFVQGPDEQGAPGSRFLVDSNGLKHAIGREDTSKTDKDAMETALFGPGMKPQRVTKEWLATLDYGEPVKFFRFPNVIAKQSAPSTVALSQDSEKKVGRVLKFEGNYYAVGPNNLFQISEFQADLMRLDPNTQAAAYGDATPTIAELGAGDYSKLQATISRAMLDDAKNLPARKSPAVNVGANDPRTVVCSTFDGYDGDKIKRSVWASTAYPADVSSDAASAHVTPGHGLLYRSLDGNSKPTADGGTGTGYLITDSGLRYTLPVNNDGGNGAAATPSANPQGGDKKGTNEAQARLGFKSVSPQFVPDFWSKLVPAGPVLNTNTALQPQNA
ncbi:type VII secretion protein EccB [Kitasatospora sp. NPDC004614]|uniref:type VII secretion protein EccB n=1 Tax=unclassified Kitasatospora TaxID=2633591 RepID=UPI00369EB9DC